MTGKDCSSANILPRSFAVMNVELLRPRVYVYSMSRIQVSPEVHFGKPCVAGTRIPVHAVLELVRDGIQPETIIRDYYTALSAEDIKACVQYAIDIVVSEDIRVAALS